MTLIINAITPRYCLQVADTRLTNANDGSLFDDDAIKTTVVYCTNAIVVISYTGLAFLDNIRTDKWVVEQLIKFKSWEKNLKEVLDYLQEVAIKQFSKVKIPNKHHSFSITGWYQGQSSIKPFFASITNCEDKNMAFIKKPLDHFEVRILTLRMGAESLAKTHAVVIQGTEAATTEKYFDRKLRKSIKETITNNSKNEEEIIKDIGGFLRIAASHKYYGKYISKKCVSVYFNVGGETPTARYHSPNGSSKEHAPNLVSKGYSLVGFEIERVIK